jgi:hypothetical protein
LLQFLCCEVAALQDAGQLRPRQLRVLTFGEIGWRLQSAQEANDAITAHKAVSSAETPGPSYQVMFLAMC